MPKDVAAHAHALEAWRGRWRVLADATVAEVDEKLARRDGEVLARLDHVEHEIAAKAGPIEVTLNAFEARERLEPEALADRGQERLEFRRTVRRRRRLAHLGHVREVERAARRHQVAKELGKA